MRLTKKMEDGTYKYIPDVFLDDCKEDDREVLNKVLQKLGKYEDQFEDPDILKSLKILLLYKKLL